MTEDNASRKARERLNQKNSRIRRAAYLKSLEAQVQKVREAETLAAVEVQSAARAALDQNHRLKLLLQRHLHVPEHELNMWLQMNENDCMRYSDGFMMQTLERRPAVLQEHISKSDQAVSASRDELPYSVIRESSITPGRDLLVAGEGTTDPYFNKFCALLIEASQERRAPANLSHGTADSTTDIRECYNRLKHLLEDENVLMDVVNELKNSLAFDAAGQMQVQVLTIERLLMADELLQCKKYTIPGTCCN